jgi:hypothetical protein
MLAKYLNPILTSKWTKVVVFLACLLPLADLLWRGYRNDLTVMTRAVKPMASNTRWNQDIQIKTFAEFSFCYVNGV